MEATFERLMDSIDKIDEKIDRLNKELIFQNKIHINSNIRQEYYYGIT